MFGDPASGITAAAVHWLPRESRGYLSPSKCRGAPGFATAAAGPAGMSFIDHSLGSTPRVYEAALLSHISSRGNGFLESEHRGKPRLGERESFDRGKPRFWLCVRKMKNRGLERLLIGFVRGNTTMVDQVSPRRPTVPKPRLKAALET